MTSLAAIKEAARSEAFARRKEAFRGRLATDADLLAEILERYRGKILSGYMPMRTEIDCLPAMTNHCRKGSRACVPVIPGKSVPLSFVEWTPTAALVDGPFGAKVPATGDILEPEVLVVPLLSFDRRGYRLGYGGGYYDRTLQQLRAVRPTVAIGFAFAGQEVAEVPIEATDQRLDMIVTECEVIGPFA